MHQKNFLLKYRNPIRVNDIRIIMDEYEDRNEEELRSSPLEEGEGDEYEDDEDGEELDGFTVRDADGEPEEGSF